MSKYYIATTTLNFNNILSSESMSPKSFYECRNYGYRRWNEIHESANDNIIVLYKEPFRFTRPKSDVEDRPLLIEIETYKNFEQISEGVYYCDHTIYLNPTSAKFIFFSEEDKKVTLSMSDSSHETKMIKLYGKRIEVDANLPQKDSLFNQRVEKECKLTSIKQDKKINKMKGLLYGYYIGAYLSEDADTIKRRNNFQDLLELFSVIRTRANQNCTQEEAKHLEELLFAVQFPNSFDLRQSIMKSDLTLEQRQLFDTYELLFKKHVNYVDTYQILNKLKDEFEADGITQKPNRAIEWLEGLKTKFEKNIPHSHLKVEKEEIITTDLSLEKVQNERLSEKENELLLKWVNEILCQEQYNSKISTFNKELSRELVLKARDFFAEKWENSSERESLNNMNKYVNGYDVHIEWKDDLVSSLTAVLKEGNDWKRLLRFMQRKGMTDYRLAFAIYGELNGFANLTRDFTDILFELKDKDYVWALYKEIIGQLLGERFELFEKQETAAIEQSKNNTHSDNSENLQTIEAAEIPSKINTLEKSITQQSPIEDAVSSMQDESNSYLNDDSINNMLDELGPKLGKNDPQIIRGLWTSTSKNEEKFKHEIGKSGKLTKKGKNAICKYWGIDNQVTDITKEDSKHVNQGTFNFPDEQKNTNFAKDKITSQSQMQTLENKEKASSINSQRGKRKQVKHNLPNLPCFEKIKLDNQIAYKRIESTWDWTINTHGKIGKEQIDHFLNTCKKEGRGGMEDKGLKGYFSEELSLKIQKELYEWQPIN